ncbi:hypothetical protein [Allorhodopirellula solitaria]|uniref:Uncharacterized protein n=1 Tax=Allorhodopirellula solitaria TaxID=2527987 RepID=A0A5C5WYF5_9BACT|nr:hypothetical protein [Allorhodopirellula solitaria]TWT55717.1 hypothetical protein CA85_48170 [Allorhodopirellula solitaria]
MSKLIWDWWFGDDPQRRLAVTRFTARRRFMVFLAAIGATHGVGTPMIWADEGAGPIINQPVSESEIPVSTFAMMLAADEVTAAQSGSAAVESSSPGLDVSADDGSRLDLGADLDAGAPLTDDEKRKERLKKLLGDNEPSAPLDRPAALDNRGTGDDEDSRDPNQVPPSIKEDGGLFSKPFIKRRYPEVEQGRFVLPPIRAVSIDQKPIGNGRIPETVTAGKQLDLIPLPEDGMQRVAISGEGVWPELIRPWAAPNTFSHPLYFEDRMLERHGHERWGYFQPFAAGTRFFVTLPMLPYLATVQPPCETVYSKGYYRAGSPVPKFLQRPPLERRAIIVEAAVVSGTFIALP